MAFSRRAARADRRIGRPRPPAQKLLAIEFEILSGAHAFPAELGVSGIIIETSLAHQLDNGAKHCATAAAAHFEILQPLMRVAAQQELIDAHEQ